MRSGDNRKKAQKHQNEFKFRANKHSKKSHDLADTPLDRMCKRCYEKIKWKLAFHKYKPLTDPAKCIKCGQKTVVKAYKIICDPCTIKFHICSCCAEHVDDFYQEGPRMTREERMVKIEEILQNVREREKRTIIRKVMKKEIDYDPIKKVLIYVGKGDEDQKEVEVVQKKCCHCDSSSDGPDKDDDNPEGDSDSDGDEEEEKGEHAGKPKESAKGKDAKKEPEKGKEEAKVKGKGKEDKEDKDGDWEDQDK